MTPSDIAYALSLEHKTLGARWRIPRWLWRVLVAVCWGSLLGMAGMLALELLRAAT